MSIDRVFVLLLIVKIVQMLFFVKKGFLGDKLYVCPYNQKKHKAIDGLDCGGFRCRNYGEYHVCESCNAGAPVKRLKRY